LATSIARMPSRAAGAVQLGRPGRALSATGQFRSASRGRLRDPAAG
jgi:hypothetical protein